MNICDSLAAPIGCNSALPLIVVAILLAIIIKIYLTETPEEKSARIKKEARN